MLLVVVIRGVFREVVALGPDFSNHDWSIIWLAIICPRERLSLGVSRWTIAGKNPNILEKWWEINRGVVLNCLVVREARSSARSRPRIETVSAPSFRRGGMDITGVFKGSILEVINRPAMMLPHTNRLIGLMTAELFSLIGDSGLNRGCPIDTKKTTRRL